jgi:YVTN family beta-propeller protein
VIDTAQNSVIATISLGPHQSGAPPAGIAVTPDGTQVYVANSLARAVQVINTATNTLATTIGINGYPFALAITPVIPFASVTGQLELSTGLQFNGTISLGSGGNINPLTQSVSLQIGTFSITIPPNSFTLTGKGSWAFEGTMNGVMLQVQITPQRTPGQFNVKIEASGVTSSTGTQVILTIGNNSGPLN